MKMPMFTTTKMGDAIAQILDEGWTLEEVEEGGQPNGVGHIEETSAREWFHPARETHHRTMIVLWGPWEEGPSEEGRREQERRAQAEQKVAELQEQRDREEYKRLKRMFEGGNYDE